MALRGAGEPCAGGESKRCRLRDRALSWGESGHSGGVDGALGALRGAARYGVGGAPHPPWICPVGVWRRVRWMRRWWRQVVRVHWLLWGLSRLGLGLGGPFGVDVVARQIRFLVGVGRFLVVGGVVGLSAWWAVLPSHALVLFVHGAPWPGGVWWWAVEVVVVGVVLGVVVVVVVVVMVVVVAGAPVAVVVVMGVVVVVVL